METEALQPLLEAMKESAEKQLQQPQSNAHATLRALLVKALNDPTIFCGFDEIKQILQPALESSSSNATTSSNNNSMLATLDLFSYGVYHDYQNAAPGTYLALTESQIFKLRQLTLLTLVEQQAAAPAVSLADPKSNMVSYQALAQHLGFDRQESLDPAAPQQAALSPAFRQVEEVIIACLYAGILSGRLCQKTQSLIVGGSTGTGGTLIQSRDVPLANVPLLWQQYNDLFQTLQQCSHQLELQASRVQKVRNDQEEYWLSVDERKRATVPTSAAAAVATSSLLRGGSGGGGSSSSFFRALTSSPFSSFSALEDDALIANPSEPSMARNSSAAASRRQPKRSRGGFGSSAQ